MLEDVAAAKKKNKRRALNAIDLHSVLLSADILLVVGCSFASCGLNQKQFVHSKMAIQITLALRNQIVLWRFHSSTTIFVNPWPALHFTAAAALDSHRSWIVQTYIFQCMRRCTICQVVGPRRGCAINSFQWKKKSNITKLESVMICHFVQTIGT